MKKKNRKPARIRRSWNLHPATRVEEDSSKYNRRKEKKAVKKILEGEL